MCEPKGGPKKVRVVDISQELADELRQDGIELDGRSVTEFQTGNTSAEEDSETLAAALGMTEAPVRTVPEDAAPEDGRVWYRVTESGNLAPW